MSEVPWCELSYEERSKLATAHYEQAMKDMETKPTPVGQKFPRGARVLIAKDLSKDGMGHFQSGVKATVEYTYAHAYGGNNIKSYSLKIDGGNSVAWYLEHQLTLLKEGG